MISTIIVIAVMTKTDCRRPLLPHCHQCRPAKTNSAVVEAAVVVAAQLKTQACLQI